jgi:hypothetical protein
MQGEKKYKVERGLASHVDDCPINIRVWQGKSYANIIDDCYGCDFCLEVSQNLGNYDFPEQSVVVGMELNARGVCPRVFPSTDKNICQSCSHK